MLEMKNNKLDSEQIRPDIWKHVPLLQHLKLQGNHITHLSAGTFSPLHNLLDLNLELNPIVEIQDKSFIGLSGLKWLFLQGTKLQEIRPKIWYGLENLTTLSWSQNEPKITLVNNSFIYLQSVAVLDVMHVADIVKPGALRYLPLLRRLDLFPLAMSCNETCDIFVGLESESLAVIYITLTYTEEHSGTDCKFWWEIRQFCKERYQGTVLGLLTTYVFF